MLAALGCGGSDGGQGQGPAEATSPAIAPRPPEPPAPSPIAQLTSLELRPVATHEGLALRVLNHGPGELELAASVALERFDGQRYAAVDPAALTLRRDCESTGCVRLAQGAELVAPCWLDRIVNARCDHPAKVPSAGRYRLVVHSCDGSASRELSLEWPLP